MDTIIYVVYREKSEESRNGAGTLVEQACFPQGKDFQVIRLTVWEAQQKIQGILRQMEILFPKMQARRLQKRQEALAAQIQTKLSPLLDKWGENACIYANPLLPNEADRKRVLDALGIPEFDGYMEFRWIARVLPYATQEHFLALGTTGCIGQVFEWLAPRMKSLMWIVPDYTYKAQAETIAEMLYEEYGLAVDLRFLTEGAVYARIQISGKYLTEPMNVLDFTGEKYVPPLALAPGSVWLDLAAVEEKERRIRGRRMPVEYVSLRTLAERL